MKDKLIELLRESTLVQGSIALILVVTFCAMAILERPIPDLLVPMISLVLGFYFGSKSQQRASKE